MTSNFEFDLTTVIITSRHCTKTIEILFLMQDFRNLKTGMHLRNMQCLHIEKH